MTSPARILFVCTGNVCRSVIAATLARPLLGEDFEVASAGIAARIGQPADPYALAALGVLGALGRDAAATRSRQLTPDLLVHSELILTATSAQRDAAVGQLPAASRRTFTLAEFARLAASRPARPPASGEGRERVRALVAEVAGLRGRGPYVDPASEDIADPRRRTESVLGCARLIARLVKDSATTLRSSPQPVTVPPRQSN